MLSEIKPLSPSDGRNMNGQLGNMQAIIVAPNGEVWVLDTMNGQVAHYPEGDPSKPSCCARTRAAVP